MIQSKSLFSFSNFILFVYAFVLLFLSTEVLYALFASQSTMTETDEFYYLIGFVRKPLVLLLNCLVIIAWLIHCFFILKNRDSFFSSKLWRFINQVSKGVSLFFIPLTMYCVFYLIPFGDAQIRTLFLNDLQITAYKLIALVGSVSVFLCALTHAFLWLSQLNILPKHPQFIVKLLVLIWAINLVYLLFLIH